VVEGAPDASETTRGQRSPWLTRTLVVLTLVSLAQDAASELLYPLLPLFLTGVLAAPPVLLGVVEGLADATAGITKFLAGKWSDRRGRKPFIAAGYGLAAAGKVLVAGAVAWPMVLLGRVVDRFGKGIRSAPRDALIAASVPRDSLGRAFGFHRAGDTLGAVIGPLLGLVALTVVGGDIRAAMWWAIVTITTVGYGDVVPITLAGRMVASMTMVMGYVMLGLPVGIVATAFAEEIHRRQFVVTWSMVASVPLFRTLDATAIAEIMRYLSAQSVPPGTLIVRRGEPAHSMYFIAEGEVEVELPNEPVRLGVGQFFGEMAILHKTLRTANVRATEPTKMLILDAFDLKALIVRNPQIGDAIASVASTRKEMRPDLREGDIVDSELKAPEPPRQELNE